MRTNPRLQQYWTAYLNEVRQETPEILDRPVLAAAALVDGANQYERELHTPDLPKVDRRLLLLNGTAALFRMAHTTLRFRQHVTRLVTT